MPHILQGMKRCRVGPRLTERQQLFRDKWNDARLPLKYRLDDNRWCNPRRREFRKTRGFFGWFQP